MLLGILAALGLDRAMERWAFLAEYAPVVTLVAVIGAYFAATGLQGLRLLSGVRIRHRARQQVEVFGFKMEAGEAQKLDESVLTTAFVMRLFVFILLGAQVDFSLMGRYWLGGGAVVTVLMPVARPATVSSARGPTAAPGNGALPNWVPFMCWTRENRRYPRRARGPVARHEGAGSAELIASVVFVAILMTILIQAPTTQWLGRKLMLIDANDTR